MRSPEYYQTKATEMDRQAVQYPPGGERAALRKTAQHMRDMAGLADWREREPPAPRDAPQSHPHA